MMLVLKVLMVIYKLLLAFHLCKVNQVNASKNISSNYVTFLENEQKLVDKLFKSYNNRLMPSGTIEIQIAFNLIQLIQIIERDQIMLINAFVDHKWVDQRLKWNPAEYGNISVIRVHGEKLWTPDTFIYSIADQNGFLIPQSKVNFVLNHKGEIFWPNPLTQLKVRCRMNILWFPFDEQLCILIFGSWSYSLKYVNYSLIDEKPSLTGYSENNVWHLVDFQSFRTVVKYDAWIENDSFSEVHYKLLIRRKPLFVIHNCVVPSIMLCILTLVSFFIPFAPQMQIGVSITLAFSVYKLRLSDDVPVQSDIIPLINVYFILCMFFSLSAMIWFSIKNLLIENKKCPVKLKYFVQNFLLFFMWPKRRCEFVESNKISRSNANSKNNNMKMSRSMPINLYLDDLNLNKNKFKQNENCKSITSIPLYEIDSHGRKSLVNIDGWSDFYNHNNNKIETSKQTAGIMKPRSILKKPLLNGNRVTKEQYEDDEEIKIDIEKTSNKIKRSEKNTINLDNIQTINILNRFVFIIYFIYFLFLNIFSLYILPFYFKKSLSLSD